MDNDKVPEGVFDDDMSDEDRKAVAEGIKKIIDSEKYDFERRMHARFADEELIIKSKQYHDKMRAYGDRIALPRRLRKAIAACVAYGKYKETNLYDLAPLLNEIVKRIARVELLRKEIEANTDSDIAVAVNIVDNYRTTIIAFASRLATVLPMVKSFIQKNPDPRPPPPASAAASASAAR
jgi:hypothetical protein